MQRDARWFWLLTYACAFACTRLAAATNASSTGTIDSPCTTCVLPVYDGRPLYVYASTVATVETYGVHYLQITSTGVHPSAGGTLLALQSVEPGLRPVTTFTMRKSDKCEILWYWSGADASMPGGRVYVMPKDGTSCPHAMHPPNASTTALESTSTPAPEATPAPNASTSALESTSTPAPNASTPALQGRTAPAPNASTPALQGSSTPAPNASTAPELEGSSTPAPNASTAVAGENTSTPAPVANTSNTSTVAAPPPHAANTSNASTAHNTSTARATLPPATTPAPLPTPVYNITYNLTIPNTHCHPAGDGIGGITLQECGDRCTDVHCSAFSFYTDLIFANVILSNMSLVTSTCYICGFPTHVEYGNVTVDGNYSSVLTPALLREHQSPYDMFNIYQPVYTEAAPAPTVCDAGSVQEWLERAIFAPVLAEANASAGGALDATREGQLLAVLAGSVAANLSHAAEDCSMPEVNTLALLDQARVALRAAGVATAPCAAFSGALLEFALAPALAELNASKQGALNDTHAPALRLLLEQQFLPALLANGSTCDPALVSNATLEAQAHAFAQAVLQNPVLAVLFGAVVEAADQCAALFESLAAGSTDGMLQELNATAGGALNATHAAAMAELVQEHLIAPLAASGANCTDLAALSAAMQPRALQLQLALAQHPLFRAYHALPADAEVVVEMTVQLGISRVQFDAAAQRNFRTGIASACSVAVEAVRITAVREVGAGRRRLLQAATQEKLEVDTQIDAAPAQALAVLAAAENSTAVQESVQAEMGGDVQVETVGTPTLAQPQRPAPSPAPSPPRANYAGQHSAKSTDEGTWSIFVVALVLLLFAFIVVFYSALSIRGWGERACVPAPGECPQPPGYLTAQLCHVQTSAPEKQNLLPQAVALSIRGWGERDCVPAPGECPQPPGYLRAQLCHAQTSAPEQQNLLPQAVFRGPYAQLGYAPAFVYAPPPGAPASDAYAWTRT